MSEVLDFLKDSKVFYLATVDSDKPKVRPFGFAMEYEGKLYFGTNESKPSYKQLKTNPSIEISATNAKNEWIRVSGEAVFDKRPEVKDKVFQVAPNLRNLYGNPDSPVLAPFYIENGEAVFSSLSGEPKTVKF